ncbi:MAG TPA: hypothetical protein VL576_01965 [Candidatus Paceibacterota bacterium]|nr:hypothetical protein [Candidatus Paceibacterota bacterium]
MISSCGQVQSGKVVGKKYHPAHQSEAYLRIYNPEHWIIVVKGARVWGDIAVDSIEVSKRDFDTIKLGQIIRVIDHTIK